MSSRVMAHGVLVSFVYARQWVWEGRASEPPVWELAGDGAEGGGLIV
jgi:hypothetical protein